MTAQNRMNTELRQAENSHVAYRERGDGPAMVLVHGWGVSGALFEPQLEALSVRFRVIAPDLPGHGASEPFPNHAPFSRLADRIAGLIGELNLERPLLVGWSLGAMVAWDLLLRYRDLAIAGMVSIDMVPHVLNDADGDGGGWTFGLRDGTGSHAFGRDLEVMAADWPAYAAAFVPRIFAPGYDGEWLGRTLEVARANDAGSQITIWKRMVEKDFRAALRTIHVPSLCVCGAQSQLYSIAACEWVAAQLPDARTAVFARSGHAPHLEESSLFNQLLADFRAGVFTTQDAMSARAMSSGDES